MAKNEETHKIYIRLQGDPKRKFLQIKRAKGLANDSEVLRLLIMEYPLVGNKKEV